MLSPPHVRFRISALLLSFMVPHVPPGVPLTKSSNVGASATVVVVLLLVVGVVVDGMVVDAPIVVVVDEEVASGHSEKSILQSAVQRSFPPGVGQVKAPNALPSHSSPGASITPSPHVPGWVVLVLVVEDDVLPCDVLVVEATVEVVPFGDVVVVVVLATSGAHATVTCHPPTSVWAHADPVKRAARPRPKRATGAVTKARTVLLAPNFTRSPRAFSSGVGVP